MITPEEYYNENERLKDLDSYAILDTLPEADYDDLTAIASEICGTHISLVSLIDNKRQWFKSHHGLDVSETQREYAFCAHAIHNPNEVLIVQDARKDARFHDNPLVKGDPHVIFYAGVPLITENGLPIGTLCVIDHEPKELSQNQIRSLKALSKQVMNLLALRKTKILLEQSLKKEVDRHREIEQFAYIASHDLQEPLNTVISFAELLQENCDDRANEIEKNSLKFIHEASNRMQVLVTGLLEYSRLGKRSEFKKIDCNVLIKEVIEYLDAPIKKSKAKILIEKLPVIEGLNIELKLLFEHLISNAIKYSKPHITPEIVISSESLDFKWKFTVKDNGIGIDQKYKNKIFLIFQRLHARKEYDGTGIGLAHCRKIVQLHYGEIWVNSEVNKGSTFLFTIHKKIKE